MKVQLVKTATATVLTGAVARLANVEEGSVLVEYDDGGTEVFADEATLAAAGFLPVAQEKPRAKRIPKEHYTNAIAEMNEEGAALTAGGLAHKLNVTTAAATRVLKSLGMVRNAETGVFELEPEPKQSKKTSNGRKRAQA